MSSEAAEISESVASPASPKPPPRSRPPIRFDRASLIRYGAPGGVFLIALFVLPAVLSSFWVQIFISVTTTTMIALGLGLLFGRVGLVSLSQVGLFSIGIWVTMRLGFATNLPYPLLLIVAGLVTMGFGVLIGLPALRLSGIYLALITLFAAGGINVILQNLQFPNGGPGFRGVVKDVSSRQDARRPTIATTDVAYLRYAVVVAGIMFLLVVWHLRNKPGRAWASIRQSEAAALAAGVNVTVYKMWAFALASFITGVAGGVTAGHIGTATPANYDTLSNILMFAVVVIGGAATLWGAVIAGLLRDALPQFFDKNLHISDRWSYILFGIGVLANLIITSRAARKKGVSL
jgi:branched-chain amino acid transport system permease protein